MSETASYNHWLIGFFSDSHRGHVSMSTELAKPWPVTPEWVAEAQRLLTQGIPGAALMSLTPMSAPIPTMAKV